MTPHYIVNLPGLLGTLHDALPPHGGKLMFSIEHPIFMASLHPVDSLDPGQANF